MITSLLHRRGELRKTWHAEDVDLVVDCNCAVAHTDLLGVADNPDYVDPVAAADSAALFLDYDFAVVAKEGSCLVEVFFEVADD